MLSQLLAKTKKQINKPQKNPPKKERTKATPQQNTLLMENLFTLVEPRNVHCPWIQLQDTEERS